MVPGSQTGSLAHFLPDGSSFTSSLLCGQAVVGQVECGLAVVLGSPVPG